MADPVVSHSVKNNIDCVITGCSIANYRLTAKVDDDSGYAATANKSFLV